MKLLFDENLSFRILPAISDLYSDCLTVSSAGLSSAPDENVWAFARDRDFIIVSEDSDFRQRTFTRGAPPKVIWLAIGNCPRDAVVLLLRTNVATIRVFAEDPESALLVLP